MDPKKAKIPAKGFGRECRFWYKEKGPKSENNSVKIMFSSLYKKYKD